MAMVRAGLRRARWRAFRRWKRLDQIDPFVFLRCHSQTVRPAPSSPGCTGAGCWLMACLVIPAAAAVSDANSGGRPRPRGSSAGIVEKLFPLFGCSASQICLRRLMADARWLAVPLVRGGCPTASGSCARALSGKVENWKTEVTTNLFLLCF